MADVIGFEGFGGVLATGTTLDVPLPAHAENDIVLLFTHFRFGLSNTPSGFTQEVFSNLDADIYCYFYIAGVTPKTTAGISHTFGSNANFDYIAVAATGNRTTSVFNVSAVRASSAGATLINPAVTTTVNNCLIISCMAGRAGDFGWTTPVPVPGNIGCGQARSDFIMSMAACYTQQPVAGTTNTFKFIGGRFNAGWNPAGITIAIRDNGDDNHGPYIDISTDADRPAEMIHISGDDFLSGELSSSTTDLTLVIPTVNGKNTSSRVLNASNDSITDGVRSAQWGNYTLPTTVETTSGVLTTSLDLTDEIFCATVIAATSTYNNFEDPAVIIGFSDGTNARLWAMGGENATPNVRKGVFPALFQHGAGFEYEDYGTFDVTDCSHVVVGQNQAASQQLYYMGCIYKLQTMKVLGGNVTAPASMNTALEVAATGILNTVLDQSGQTSGQFYCCHKIQVGNGGTDAVYWDSTNQAFEFPAAASVVPPLRPQAQINASTLGFVVDAGTGNTVILANQVINGGDLHVFELLSGNVTASGIVVINAPAKFGNLDNPIGGISISGCPEVAVLTGMDLSGGCFISESTDTHAITVTTEALFEGLHNCTFTNNNRAIQITGNQTHTGSGWDDPNLTVSGNTFDIEYTGTTNFSIQSANTLSVNNTSSGTLTIVTPVLTLNINSDTASTLIRYFEDDSQTVVDSTTGTTLAYNFPDTDVIDIELVKQSYVPVNRQDVTPFDGDFDIIMDFDESYNSGHGLTITTEYDYVRATKVLTINSDQSALDVRSSLADVIRTNSSYFNTSLLMMSIPGLTRVDLTNGMTITSMATWKGAGMEMFDAADSSNPLEKWFAMKSGGDITGATTHFRQTDSGNSTAVTLTNNVVDEAFQYFDDPNHDGSAADGFDFSDYMVTKAFLAGSKQARSDLLVAAGVSEIASNSYQIVLANADHGYSGSDPGITGDLTLVTGGTFGGKTFAYEIIDGGVNTGADIADQFNFNAASNPNTVIPGGTGLRYFELNDMVIHNASAVETERGFEEGTTPVLVGFYCSRASADHPGFTRFQADDGTYFTPAVTSNVSITGMPAAGNEIRLQIYNVTAQTADAWADTTVYVEGDKVLRSTGVGTEQTAGLYMVCTVGGTSGGSEPTWDTTVGNTTVDNTVTWTTYAILFTDADPVGTGFADSYTDGEEFIGGDTFRIRFAELNTTTSFKTFETTGIVSSSGFAVAVSVTSDSVYASNGIDGSSTAVTDIFTADYVNNEIDLDTNMDFTHPKAFAFVSFEQTTSQGMFQIWRIVNAIDAGNYLNDVDVLGILFDETAGFVKQEDSDVSRWYRTDGARPFKDPTTGGNGISMNWKNPVFTISTGSVLTSLEKSQLETSATESTEVNTKIGTPTDTDVSTDIANVQTAVDAGGGGDATEAKQDQILSDLSAKMATTHISATAGKVDGVLLVDQTTVNDDMVGTDGANTVVPDNAGIAAIKTKTDELTFTKANELDSNIQSVNDTTVVGDGQTGTEWGS